MRVGDKNEAGAQQPVIVFALEYAQAMDSTAELVTGLRRSIDLIKDVGCQAIGLSGAPSSKDGILGRQDLGIDRFCFDIHGLSARMQCLTDLGAWAFVSSNKSDMKVARNAEVRAIGLAVDDKSAQSLRRAGAHTVLDRPEELIDVVRFPGDLLSGQKGAKMLGVEKSTLNKWAHDGVTPREIDAFGRMQYPASFIGRLAEMALAAPLGRDLASFCRLEWDIWHGDIYTARDALRAARQLHDSGELLSARQAAEVTTYARNSVELWPAYNLLPYIRMQGRRLQGSDQREYRLFRSVDIERVARLMGSMTVYEAGAELGLSKVRVTQLVALGQLKATPTPAGLRFDPQEVELCLHRRHEQVVRPRRSGPRVRYDPSKEPFELGCALNLGFEWVAAADQESGTSQVKQTARLLGIAAKTLLGWNAEDILPYYRPGAQHGYINSPIYYPRSYTEALVAYAGGPPVSIRAARAFRQLCWDAGQIVRTAATERSP